MKTNTTVTTLVLAAAALLIGVFCTSCSNNDDQGSGDSVKIAYFVSDFKNGFHQAQSYWAKKYAKEKYGADVQVFDGKSDVATMTANVDQMIAQGMDMATLHIWQGDSAKPGLEEALKKGIILASYFDRMPINIPIVRPGEAEVSFQMGKISAEQWMKAHPDKPIVMVQLGWPDNEAVAEGRTVPFVKGVKSVAPNAKDLGCYDCSRGPDVAKKTIQDLVNANRGLCLIYSEASNLTDGTMPGLRAIGRGKMKDGVPLTEIVVSTDCPENELFEIYDPNSSLKMSMGIPPRETGMGRIDNLFAIKEGKIKQVDEANKKAIFIPNSLIGYWNMKPDDAVKWYNEQYNATVTMPKY
ncbi:MAG: substrate-binding domain-containing protein [Phycisphaerae bacterium]|jgi:ABC-type sugar transport system substrate-binding protein|nr:substrate-binding domain-containing protein [Phycisphaerae bacterium]